jgi:hypothetical protein
VTNSERLYKDSNPYRAATDAAIAQNRAKGNLARFDQSVVEFLSSQTSPFFQSLYSQIERKGSLSDKQLTCVRQAMQKDAESKESFNAGTEGLEGEVLEVESVRAGQAHLLNVASTPKACTIQAKKLRKGDLVVLFHNQDFSKVVVKYATRKGQKFDY